MNIPFLSYRGWRACNSASCTLTVLTKGTISKGTVLFTGNAVGFEPKYPEQKVNDFCLSAAATLDEILNDLCNIIIPDKMNEIMGDKIGKNKVL